MVRDPETLERVRRLFESRYGPGVWTAYFATSGEALRIFPHDVPGPSSSVDRIRGEFDSVSSGYEAALARKPIDRYLKDRVVAIAVDSLSGLDPILEIGPGTGYHTLPLLAAGHRIVAVDISEGMLDQLRARATKKGLGDRLETRTASLGNLGASLADLSDGFFAAAFSAFGAFNLEPDVDAVTLGRLLRPGGRLLFTSLNRPGLVPLVWEFALGRPTSAGYRIRGEAPPGGIRYPLALYLGSPRDWDHALGGVFQRISVVPVSVLAPPFDSDRVVRFLGTRGSERARRWDSFLSASHYSWAASEWVSLLYTRLPASGLTTSK